MTLRMLVNAQPHLNKVFERDFDDGLLAYKLSKVRAKILDEVQHFVDARNKYIRQHGKDGAIDQTDLEALQKFDTFCQDMLEAETELQFEPLFAVGDVGKNAKLGAQSSAVVGALVSVGLMADGEGKGDG